MLRYVIQLAPVTKKNSAQILRRGAGGRPFVAPLRYEWQNRVSHS